MSNPDRYMDSFLDHNFDKPASMAEYLQDEGLRLEKEISDAAIHAELKR